MELAFRDLAGPGRTIVFLHGLFGSSQNWVGMGRRLSGLGRCALLDLRNHGESPHASTHTLADCVQDVADWTRAHAARPVLLVGHSMGGLIAMAFALWHPEMTGAVASLDIAPRVYPPEHGRELAALRTDIRGCRTRAELDALLSPLLPDIPTRQFILTNAERDGEGFRWRLNVAALETSTLTRDFAGVNGRFEGPALLVTGGRSSYVTSADHALMRGLFPKAQIQTIPNADHWLHVSAPEDLARILTRFLEQAIKEGLSRP